MTGPELGIISDTHGLVRPEAIEALAGVELIVHAGDVGGPDVLAALAAIAPVRAVRGNCDHGAWAEQLPGDDVVQWRGCSLYVLHDLAKLQLDPRAAQLDALVYGHSHRPEIRRHGSVLHVNPGSAGPRRFDLPVTLARAARVGDVLRVRLVPLG